MQVHEQAELAAVYRVYSLLAGDGSGDASVHHSNWHMWKILVEVAVAKLAETNHANERRGDAVSQRGRAASLAPGSEETSDIARIFTEVMLEQLQSLSPKLRLVAYLRLSGSSLMDVACQLNCSVRQAERYERSIEHHWTEPGTNAQKAIDAG